MSSEPTVENPESDDVPTPQGQPFEEDIDETDSTLGSDVSSISETLASSVMDYPFENGRRYHAYEAGKYNLPNDEAEADRLDLQHQIFLLTHKGKLYKAPLSPDITDALDVGTGTGIWAIEFADAHPHCNTIGTDLSPIQPTWVPSNCRFIVDDAESQQGWDDFPQMDYVHSRFMTLALRDWPSYVQRCYQTVKPGGWVEFAESSLPLKWEDGSSENPNDDAYIGWSHHMYDACVKAGVKPANNVKLSAQMREAGFINVVEEVHKWPLGPWLDGEDEADDERVKKMGRLLLYNASKMLDSSSAFFTRLLGWEKSEVDVFMAKCRDSIMDAKKHRYVEVTVHYGQRPTE